MTLTLDLVPCPDSPLSPSFSVRLLRRVVWTSHLQAPFLASSGLTFHPNTLTNQWTMVSCAKACEGACVLILLNLAEACTFPDTLFLAPFLYPLGSRIYWVSFWFNLFTGFSYSLQPQLSPWVAIHIFSLLIQTSSMA